MKCGMCTSDNWIDAGFEIACGNCGFVSGEIPVVNGTSGTSQILLHQQGSLGSDKIISDELSLPSINKKKTAVILVKHDNALIDFSKCCNSLRLPRSTAQIAFSLFKKLRYRKLGNGKLAVFCIVYACIETEMVFDEKLLIAKIQSSFSLKRKIKISHALYKITPVALEENLISSNNENLKYLIKKYCSPENQIQVVKIIDLWNGKSVGKNARTSEDFLKAYT